MLHVLGSLVRDYVFVVLVGAVLMVPVLIFFAVQERWRNAGSPSVMDVLLRRPRDERHH